MQEAAWWNYQASPLACDRPPADVVAVELIGPGHLGHACIRIRLRVAHAVAQCRHAQHAAAGADDLALRIEMPRARIAEPAVGVNLRSVVDYRGQAVCALNRITSKTEIPIMAIWGDQDAIIPLTHAYAAQQVRPDIRLEVLSGVGHFPQVERPGEVVELIEDFLSHDVASITGISPHAI